MASISAVQKLAFIGAGGISETHARALRKLPGVEIAAWHSASGISAAQQAQRHGGVALSLEKLLDRDDLDAVMVCSPTHLHSQHVRLALAAGKKVFCEKPLARTLADARKIAARARGRLYVGHVLRFFHEYRLARTFIREGRLGKVIRVACRRLNRPPRGSGNWFLDARKSGGVLLDLLIHDFDWLLWTFGPPAQLHVETEAAKDPTALRHARVLCGWPEGLSAELEGSWVEATFSRELRVIGKKASLHTAGGRLLMECKGATSDCLENALPDPYVLQMQHFLEWLRGGPPVVTVEEAVAAVALSLQALEASAHRAA